MLFRSDEISSSRRQFLFDYKVVNSALDNLLISGSEINTRSSRSGDDEISSSRRQFLFDYKVVNSALDNLLVSGSEIFIDFSLKRCQESCRKASFW